MIKELIGIAAVAAAAGIAGYAIAKKEDEENCDCYCDDCSFFDDDDECPGDCYEGNPDAVLDDIAPFTHIDDEGREVDSKGNIVDDEDDDNLCDHDYNCTGCPHEDECEEKYNPVEESKSDTETTDATE